jgi:hypothetical protein
MRPELKYDFRVTGVLVLGGMVIIKLFAFESIPERLPLDAERYLG